MPTNEAISPMIPMRNLQPADDDSAGQEACIANISPAERRARLRFGIVQFVIALVITAVLVGLGADRLWRLGLFALFAAAAGGYFQFRDKT